MESQSKAFGRFEVDPHMLILERSGLLTQFNNTMQQATVMDIEFRGNGMLEDLSVRTCDEYVVSGIPTCEGRNRRKSVRDC
ncbi:hypothetical protein [Pseudomonas marginalis]|uniref:Uncharacterized protein n=1 Tax=Pseudomonas marginalis TaxID=298 RepID=A0A9X5KQJ3_PSEMA|nr:hypothetical protein [Pseudomonas marginalis]OAJ45582.1 hypothetical protein AO064_29595 [Pseudomonas marginalis]